MRKVQLDLMRALISLSIPLMAACSSAPSSQQILETLGMEGLFTTRPSATEPSIMILKLQNPALLETAEKANGKVSIDEELLTAITAEQEATIAELQKISSEIKILTRYKLVLNGMAIWAPADALEKIKTLPNVIMSEKAAGFSRPQLQTIESKGLVGENTSVKFIGSEAAYAQNIRGEGLKVGIIDTGVDYTHKMFFGEGTAEAYKSINPSQATAAFPNKKVVGGIDLVGTDYNSASPDFKKRIPTPDLNPLDEGGHGTHVAGTVAGIGDGVQTYSGVAPAADLYAIKVFGADGSTSDEVVIAALEYAADPTADLTFSQQLDVVNLSLGSGYGNPHIMYNQAIKNLVRGGTIVVASGGNSGDKSYIVGSPGISDDAISVASSVDNMDVNIKFPTVEFAAGNDILDAELIEAAITEPLSGISELSGEVIFLGLADKDFDNETVEKTKGKIALIDRGAVAFADKIRRAQEAGAIGVVVANNSDEEPIVMGGGEEKFKIPAVMISKAAGKEIKQHLQSVSVIANLKSTKRIEKPSLIDTISSFSSRGPRSEDGLIKPEIAAPGSNTISAAMGEGDKGVAMSGTSMAGPHIAGVMALLKQKHKDLNPYELKSVLLGQGKVIKDKSQKIYSVSRQGAGRVQVARSLEANVIALPGTLSLGLTDVEKQKTLKQTITLKNIGKESVTLNPDWSGSEAMQISVAAVTLAPGESKTIPVSVKILANKIQAANVELDGYLRFNHKNETQVQVPALAVVRKISQISATAVVVDSTSEADSAGSSAQVEIVNKGVNAGSAYLFNLIDLDARKKDPKPDHSHNRNCDMQSAGYRLVEKKGIRILQIAIKIYEGMTTWNACEVNVQIDGDNDNQTDQEIAGLPQDSLPGLDGENFVSLLLDGKKAKDLRKKFESDFVADPKKAKEDYTTAVIDLQKMHVFDNSTLAIIEADVSALAIAETGELNLKISTTHQDASVVEYDDYLAQHESKWHKISVGAQAAAFSQIPEEIKLQGQESTTVSLQKGYGNESLILYAPQNRAVKDVLLEDSQSIIVPTKYSQE